MKSSSRKILVQNVLSAVLSGKCVMREQLEKRLAELKQEYESGQKMMTELETKQNNLRDTLLRISGAIQILEEELSEAPNAEQNGVVLDPEAEPVGQGVYKIPLNILQNTVKITKIKVTPAAAIMAITSMGMSSMLAKDNPSPMEAIAITPIMPG